MPSAKANRLSDVSSEHVFIPFDTLYMASLALAFGNAATSGLAHPSFSRGSGKPGCDHDHKAWQPSESQRHSPRILHRFGTRWQAKRNADPPGLAKPGGEAHLFGYKKAFITHNGVREGLRVC